MIEGIIERIIVNYIGDYIEDLNKDKLGIGDWGLGPIPNPQSPIPKIILIIQINTIK